MISWGEIAVESDTSLQEKCNSDVPSQEGEECNSLCYLLSAGEHSEAAADSG